MVIGIIGTINFILAIWLVYFAFKNVIELKGATAQNLMLVGALFFAISSFISVIGPFVFDTIFNERYTIFIAGFILILMGEAYSSKAFLKVVGKNPWLAMTRAFSHKKYRVGGVLLLLFFTIPLLTYSTLVGQKSIYGVATLFLTSLSFVLLLIGERQLYVTANVFSDTGTIVEDIQELKLLRDDIACVRVYSDIINRFLYFAKPILGTKVVNDTLIRWSEEHPVLFENCLTASDSKIDTNVVIKNLDRVYEKGRLPIILKEFSILVSRFVNLYSGATSSEHAIGIFTENFKVVKKLYSESPILFDILRTMPEGILEEAKLALLSREELETKVKQRTAELETTLDELKIKSIELRREKAFTENIVTSMADTLIVVGTDGNIINVNKATLNLLNYSENELIGQPMVTIVSLPESDESNESVKEKGIKEGAIDGLTWLEKLIKKSSLNIEVNYKTKYGKKIPVNFSCSIMRDDDGTVQGFVCVARDITDRKRVENLIHTQRDLGLSLSATYELDEGLHLCFEAALKVSDMDSGGFYLVNDSSGALDLVFHKGLSPEIVRGVSHFDSNSYYTRLVMRGKPIYTKHQELDVQFRGVGQNEGFLAIAIIPVYFEDRVIGCLSIVSHTLNEVPLFAQDALEMIAAQIGSAIARLRAEDALRESEERYSTIVESANDGIIIVKNQGIVFANKKHFELTGYMAEDLKGLNLVKITNPKHIHKLLNRYRRRMAGEKVSDSLEIELIHKDGHTIPVELSSARIEYQGNPADVVFTHDITDRKRAEEEIKRKNEELLKIGDELRELNIHLEQKVEERTNEIEKILKHKDEFINQLGHDLKTPLTPLTSLLPIIEEKETDEKSRELLEICVHNVEYIKNLVVSTLQLARLNSPNTVFDLRDIRLSDVVDSVFCDIQTIFEENSVNITNKVSKEIIVLADELRLKEVLNNLMTNAIKFMESGGKLTLDAKENDDGFATISVTDTGIGLGEEEKARLFEEFYKADRSRHELASSGLGLAICKRIVERHGGKIWAESPGKGKGTTFYLTLKLAKKGCYDNLEELIVAP